MNRIILCLVALTATACAIEVEGLDELTADGGPLARQNIWEDIPEPVLDRLLGGFAETEEAEPEPVKRGPFCWSAPGTIQLAYTVDGRPETFTMQLTADPPLFWPSGMHIARVQWGSTDLPEMSYCGRSDCSSFDIGLRSLIGPRVWVGYRWLVEARPEDGGWVVEVDYADDPVLDIILGVEGSVTAVQRYETTESGIRKMTTDSVVGSWQPGCAYSLSQAP